MPNFGEVLAISDYLLADPPRHPLHGKPGMHPAFVPNYRGPTLLAYLKTDASEEEKQYVKDTFKWHRENPGHWRPAWVNQLRLAIQYARMSEEKL